MTAARRLQLVSIEEYLERELLSDVKHEYMGGYVYAMAGSRNTHNTIAVAFLGLMYAALRGRPCQPFNSDTKVRCQSTSHTRFYYPDGQIVCEGNPGNDTFQDRPVVIAEVVSPSTRRIDEREKRDAYLTIPSLASYLLIETTEPRVVVYQREKDGFHPQEYTGLDAVIPLDAVGTQLRLAELYERVDFAHAIREAEDESNQGN